MPAQESKETKKAFEYCKRLATAHYENFPVASLLLPRRARPYIYSIYAFARTADDFADEGTWSVKERLRLLDDWHRQLDECCRGNATHPIFLALQETIARKGIPRDPLERLLQAFRMDVTKHRFATFDEVLFYCRHSANPVGELVLYVFDCATPQAIAHSDRICTGLQLANFWQDFHNDWRKGRLYVPLEDLARFGYTENDIHNAVTDQRFRDLLRWEVDRTRGFLRSGVPLLDNVPPRLKFELDVTIRGGLAILRTIERQGYDLYVSRPTLSAANKLRLLLQAVFRQER
jgi:squalene synthase HpnC